MKKIIFFMILILLISFISLNTTGFVTRIISGDYDNKETLICNSNGNCWEPTGENIQLAIDDLNSGTVWLPPGTFNIDSLDSDIGGTEKAIEINQDNIRLIGSGTGSTTIESTEPTIWPLWLEADNLTIKDFTINMYGGGDRSGNAIQVRGKNMVVENINVIHPNYLAIYVTGNTQNSFFNNIYIQLYDNSETNPSIQGFGTSEHSFNNTISNIIIDGQVDAASPDNGTVGFSLHSRNTAVSNVVITGNGYGFQMDIKDESGATYGAEDSVYSNIIVAGEGQEYWAYRIHQAHNSLFQNLQAKNTGGFFIGSTGSGNECENLVFDGIIMEDCSKGIKLYDGHQNIAISNTIIKNSGEEGIDAQNGGTNIAVTNSQFVNNGEMERFEGITGLTFSNNKIINNQQQDHASFYISDCKDFVINGNTITEGNKYGLFINHAGGVCEDFIISDNIIRNNGEQGIFVSNAAHNDYLMTNNIVNGHSVSQITDLGTGANKINGDNLT